MHVQRSVKSVRRKAKRTHYIERVWGCECVFELHRTRRYSQFSRRPRTLFASLGAAALSRTHRSRCRLHGGEAAFTLCLLLCFCTGLLALSSLLPSQLLPFLRRDNETASAPITLEKINLRKCTQLFVNRIFNCIPKRDGCLHTSHTFNCISEAWQIAFLKHDTAPLKPRTHTARLVAWR